jgi:addiction module HigA family antidote
MINEKLPPIHPGEILREEFIKPMNINIDNLAKNINVSAIILQQIISETKEITPEIALRLSKYFGLSEKFWLNIQLKYDLEVTKDKLEDKLDQEIQPIKY